MILMISYIINNKQLFTPLQYIYILHTHTYIYIYQYINQCYIINTNRLLKSLWYNKTPGASSTRRPVSIAHLLGDIFDPIWSILLHPR